MQLRGTLLEAYFAVGVSFTLKVMQEHNLRLKSSLQLSKDQVVDPDQINFLELNDQEYFEE